MWKRAIRGIQQSYGSYSLSSTPWPRSLCLLLLLTGMAIITDLMDSMWVYLLTTTATRLCIATALQMGKILEMLVEEYKFLFDSFAQKNAFQTFGREKPQYVELWVGCLGLRNSTKSKTKLFIRLVSKGRNFRLKTLYCLVNFYLYIHIFEFGSFLWSIRIHRSFYKTTEEEDFFP